MELRPKAGHFAVLPYPQKWIPEMPRMLREDEAKRLRPRSRSEEVSFDEDVIYRLCGDGERAPRPECLCVRRGQPADLQDRVPGDPLRDARGAAGHLPAEYFVDSDHLEPAHAERLF